jgi:hypothetical protein
MNRKHERRFLIGTLVAIASGLMLAGCGGELDTRMGTETEKETDTDGMGMSMEQAAYVGACNEARGALYRLGQMTKRAQPVSVSDLSYGAGYMLQLADHQKAPADIRRRIDEWRAAVIARSDEITSLPPRIENGRVIEPDTTDMDRRMLERVKPHGPPLVIWVRDVCGDLEDPFA